LTLEEASKLAVEQAAWRDTPASTDNPGNSVIIKLLDVLVGAIERRPDLLLLEGKVATAASSKRVFVPTPRQKAILKALDGRSLKKQQLANEACEGEGTRLYRKGGIHELRSLGLVEHKPGIGYYRPDRPPAAAMKLT
jgi:hypothetical protein